LRSHGLMTPVKTRRPAPTKETDMRTEDTRRYDNLT
jgi:hypothetical protein